MPKSVNLVLAIHNHQPVGNLENVLELAYGQSYKPFLDIIEEFTDIKLCLHYSGVLLEWLERTHPKFITRLTRLVQTGQVELLGGGFADPILTMLSEQDRIGQIKYFSEYLEERFNITPIGAWLAERVWEQHLTNSLATAKIRYTLLDDFHFKSAGLLEKDLKGYFITEDQCQQIDLFPISEKLRYAIPFKEPEATIEYLRHSATESGENIIVYGDDGEKFGIWPKTYQHCYQDKWLDKFFRALRANNDWLKIITFAEALNKFPPAGKIYLPDGAYREMTEWALPVESAMAYEDLVKRLKDTGLYERAQGYLKGGFWRNFKVKYPEINILHAKMCEVSARLEQLPKESKAYQTARVELYRGQNNCPYWHGVFGGFYLPHLRTAAYQHLIKAENIIRAAQPDAYPEVEIADFDLDDAKEIRLSNKYLNCYLKPSGGGHLYELDLLEKNFNPLATLARRQEAYHYKILQAQQSDINPSAELPGTAVKTIHELLVTKEKGLENLLYYDNYPRASLVDHFFSPDTTLENFAMGHYAEQGDFIKGNYQYEVRKNCVLMNHAGRIKQGDKIVPLKIEKHIGFTKGDMPGLEIKYRLTNPHNESITTVFGIEFNLAMLAGNASDRFYYDTTGKNLGPLITQGKLTAQKRFGIKDLWQKIDIGFEFGVSTEVRFFPVQTVSQSEAGFELIYQSSAILAYYPLTLAPDQNRPLKILIYINSLS